MIAEWSKSLIGKKVKVEGRDEIFTIAYHDRSSSRPAVKVNLNGDSYGVYYLSELTLFSISIDLLKSDLKKLQVEVKALEDKIEFLATNNLTEWDEDIFKAYQAIKLFNLAGDDAMDKAKKLIAILN